MKIAAIMLVFKERHFVRASIQAVYPHVDAVCCATAYDRNLEMRPVEPDDSVARILSLPDPDNKIRLVVRRSLDGLPGLDNAARLRNAAMRLAPDVDYYLIIDSDEIWDAGTFRRCRDEIARTRHAGYRIYSHTYFKRWNYRAIEPGEGYRPFVFLKRGFEFSNDRQVNWRTPARWKEYLRTGRKPKTVFFPSEWRMHHGSSVGDDQRMRNKLLNYSHNDQVDPGWFERVWKNFDPSMRNIHYFKGLEHLLEGVTEIPTRDLPAEVRNAEWPEGWINPA